MIEFSVNDMQGAISPMHLTMIIDNGNEHDETDIKDTVHRLSRTGKNELKDIAEYLKTFLDKGDIVWDETEIDDVEKSIIKSDDIPFSYDNMLKFIGPFPQFSHDILAQLKSMRKLLWDKYQGVSKDSSDRIGDMIFKRVADKVSLNQTDLVKAIQDIDPGIDDPQASAIARTELMNIVNNGRELQWKNDDPDGDIYNYKLVGPTDFRTCWAHKEISRRQGQGMPLNDLKAMVKEVFREAQARGDFKGLIVRGEFGIHPNLRHLLVRGSER